MIENATTVRHTRSSRLHALSSEPSLHPLESLSIDTRTTCTSAYKRPKSLSTPSFVQTLTRNCSGRAIMQEILIRERSRGETHSFYFSSFSPSSRYLTKIQNWTEPTRATSSFSSPRSKVERSKVRATSASFFPRSALTFAKIFACLCSFL